MDPISGLRVPTKFRGWEAATDFRTYSEESLGSSIPFVHETGFQATFYVYNMGHDVIPDGTGSPVVISHFESNKTDIGKAFPVLTPFKDEKLDVLTNDRTLEWLCSRCDLVMNDEQQISWVYICGAKNNFLKFRHTYPPNLGDAAKEMLRDLAAGVLNSVHTG